MDDTFGKMQEPARRAARYRRVAAEYSKLAEGATSPLFRAYYERIARQYREHATGIRYRNLGKLLPLLHKRWSGPCIASRKGRGRRSI
jgi:hypothetical protein